jgi:hypothetical protein
MQESIDLLAKLKAISLPKTNQQHQPQELDFKLTDKSFYIDSSKAVH